MIKLYRNESVEKCPKDYDHVKQKCWIYYYF